MANHLSEFDEILENAVNGPENGHKLPNVAVIAVDKNDNVLHAKIAGSYVPFGASEKDTEPRKFDADTICWMASCTKLMTSVAAMQCIEKGLIALNDDVSQGPCPELRDLQVLERMESDGPVLRPAKGKITLRNLLTHSSGFSYDFLDPTLMAWRNWEAAKSSGKAPPASLSLDVSEWCNIPLKFDPDNGWTYGYGIDWVGKIVERLTNLTLEEYMQKNIWSPLGMKSMSFDPTSRSDLRDRCAGMSVRHEADGKLSNLPGGFQQDVIKFSGGGGCWGTCNDLIKFLTSLLKRDGKLLKTTTIEQMFTGHLVDPSHAMRVLSNPLAYGLAGNIPAGTKLDFGLGGVLNLEEISTTGRAGGSMQWGGLPNLFWWINPEDGNCGCYFGQLVPPGDRDSFMMYEKFEAHVNKAFKKTSQQRENL